MIDTKSEGSTPPTTKTSFVLSLPRETPATEVVAKATAAGLSISEHYVHTIRSAAKAAGAKKKGAKKSGKKAAKKVAGPAKKAAAAPTPKARKKGKAKKAAAAPAVATGTSAAKKSSKRGPTGDKRAFIESQPATMTGSAVVAAAKKAGISISANYVYKIRNGSKGKGKAKSKAPVAVKPAAAATTKHAQPASGGSPETVLSNLVVLHGIGRVRSILNEVEHRVTRLLSGK